MKMNGKKLTALLGTAVLAMGILAGCGSSTTETTAAGTAAPDSHRVFRCVRRDKRPGCGRGGKCSVC